MDETLKGTPPRKIKGEKIETSITPSSSKRKRTPSIKFSENADEKPAKTSRRGSGNAAKKFDQVENELEAMFAGLESPVKKETPVKKDIKKEVKKTPTRRYSEPKVKEEWKK